MHLFDEIWNGESHYLNCDVCGFCVDIAVGEKDQQMDSYPHYPEYEEFSVDTICIGCLCSTSGDEVCGRCGGPLCHMCYESRGGHCGCNA